MGRQLKPEERALLKFMLEQSGRSDLASELESSVVTDMADGGMGSVLFVRDTPQKLGAVLCEAETTDSDNIPLLISINLDKEGRLFELDMWKVNYLPLQTYPSPSTLRFSQPR